MKKIFKLSPLSITALAIVIGIAAFLYGIPFMDIMELKTIDLRFEARGTTPPGSQVVLAVVDEKSLEKEGKWIWPCLLYTSPSPRDRQKSRMPSSA